MASAPTRRPARVSAHGDTCIYFGCPDPDAAWRFLTDKGLHLKPPQVAHYGMKQLYLTDPTASASASNGKHEGNAWAVKMLRARLAVILSGAFFSGVEGPASCRFRRMAGNLSAPTAGSVELSQTTRAPSCIVAQYSYSSPMLFSLPTLAEPEHFSLAEKIIFIAAVLTPAGSSGSASA